MLWPRLGRRRRQAALCDPLLLPPHPSCNYATCILTQSPFNPCRQSPPKISCAAIFLSSRPGPAPLYALPPVVVQPAAPGAAGWAACSTRGATQRGGCIPPGLLRSRRRMLASAAQGVWAVNQPHITIKGGGGSRTCRQPPQLLQAAPAVAAAPSQGTAAGGGGAVRRCMSAACWKGAEASIVACDHACMHAPCPPRAWSHAMRTGAKPRRHRASHQLCRPRCLGHHVRGEVTVQPIRKHAAHRATVNAMPLPHDAARSNSNPTLLRTACMDSRDLLLHLLAQQPGLLNQVRACGVCVLGGGGVAGVGEGCAGGGGCGRAGGRVGTGAEHAYILTPPPHPRRTRVTRGVHHGTWRPRGFQPTP